ncbi:hypothetical protein AgCh_034407 [Apium graveolens]
MFELIIRQVHDYHPSGSLVDHPSGSFVDHPSGSFVDHPSVHNIFPTSTHYNLTLFFYNRSSRVKTLRFSFGRQSSLDPIRRSGDDELSVPENLDSTMQLLFMASRGDLLRGNSSLCCSSLPKEDVENSLKFRILDEADEMLRMGFVEDVQYILGGSFVSTNILELLLYNLLENQPSVLWRLEYPLAFLLWRPISVWLYGEQLSSMATTGALWRPLELYGDHTYTSMATRVKSLLP